MSSKGFQESETLILSLDEQGGWDYIAMVIDF